MHAPRRNPKLYHPPVLLTSYILTLSENRLIMNVMMQMSPCHRPAQKPAGLSMNLDSGPAVQPAIIVINTKTVPTVTILWRNDIIASFLF
jgi:hypothetical protein